VADYRLLSEARQELEAAVSFYDVAHFGLGRDFALEVQALCRHITESPLSGIEVRSGIRRRILRRFPYAILYAIEDDMVVIVAVAHQRRRPGYWERRKDI
jgi:plasmid stabilization system protein ParE